MSTFRITNEDIVRERERFDRAQLMVKAGDVEGARRVWWHPPNEDPPKRHWSRTPVPHCSCGKRSSFGPLALCTYCQGTTDRTPSEVPRVRRSYA